MSNSLNQAGLFLVQTVFDLYLLVLLLRLLMQKFRASYHNPLSQFVLKITNPVVKPLQSLLPGIAGFDLAIIMPLIFLAMLKFALLVWLQASVIANPLGLFIWAIGALCGLVLNFFFFAIIIRIILSWVAPQSRHPAVDILYVLTEPLMAPARRALPAIAGFDLSPILIMIILQLLQILISANIIKVGAGLVLG